MTSPGDRDGQQPIDPDFAGLFRPDDEPAAAPRSPEPVAPQPLEPEPTDAATEREPEAQETRPADPEPAPAATPVDTGRLFRSQGVSDHPEAVLALSSAHFGRLRTLKRDKGDPASAVPEAVEAPIEAPIETSREEAVHEAVVSSAGPVVLGDTGTDSPVFEDRAPLEEDSRGMRRTRGGRQGRTIGAGAVYLIVIGVTVLVGFANALLADGSIGWPTGLALVISSVYAALTVRREDDTVAFLTPPVAFFLAALTAGQVFVDSLEGSFLNRAVILFFSLADNWIWIIGATLAALVIVLVRRRSSR